MELEIPTGGKGGGRRKSQEFRDLCQKFDGRKKEGFREDARMKSGRGLNRHFINQEISLKHILVRKTMTFLSCVCSTRS